jgi:hypothetical protein
MTMPTEIPILGSTENYSPTEPEIIFQAPKSALRYFEKINDFNNLFPAPLPAVGFLGTTTRRYICPG